MIDIQEQKRQANELRKSGKVEEALPLYEQLWEASNDEYDGAGYLHCLRKTKQYSKAIPLASELIERYPAFNWIRIEAIWTYISGQLLPLDDKQTKDKQEIAQKIIALNPDDIPLKTVVFNMLKSAKTTKNWDIFTNWIDRINPTKLKKEPQMINGKEGWSDQALWYYYKSMAIIHSGNYEGAIPFIDKAMESFPKQSKYFLICQAHAYAKLNHFKEAEQCYQTLSRGRNPDWWIYSKYANIIIASGMEGRENEVLQKMCLGASKCYKRELGVTLFKDLGFFLQQNNQLEEARNHLLLAKYTRDSNDWHVEEDIVEAIEELDEILGDDNRPNTVQEAYKNCKQFWGQFSEDEGSRSSNHSRRNVRKDLQGTVYLGNPDRSYCFINTYDGESFFCSKMDLPEEIPDRTQVMFDGFPSYDRKKDQESWKARNVKQIP